MNEKDFKDLELSVRDALKQTIEHYQKATALENIQAYANTASRLSETLLRVRQAMRT